MDRGLRIGAPDRRHPRPPDAPRPHPRDERRELQATREPKAQSLNPIHAVRLELAFGQCALARVRYLGTTRAKARVRPDQWELSRRCIDQSCSGIDIWRFLLKQVEFCLDRNDFHRGTKLTTQPQQTAPSAFAAWLPHLSQNERLREPSG